MAKIPKNYWAEDDTTEGKFRIFSYPLFINSSINWLGFLLYRYLFLIGNPKTHLKTIMFLKRRRETTDGDT